MSVPSELQPIIEKINKIFDSPRETRAVFYSPTPNTYPPKPKAMAEYIGVTALSSLAGSLARIVTRSSASEEDKNIAHKYINDLAKALQGSIPENMPEFSDSEEDKYVSDLIDQVGDLSKQKAQLISDYDELEQKLEENIRSHNYFASEYETKIKVLEKELKIANENKPAELKELKDKIKQLENDIECMNL